MRIPIVTNRAEELWISGVQGSNLSLLETQFNAQSPQNIAIGFQDIPGGAGGPGASAGNASAPYADPDIIIAPGVLGPARPGMGSGSATGGGVAGGQNSHPPRVGSGSGIPPGTGRSRHAMTANELNKNQGYPSNLHHERNPHRRGTPCKDCPRPH